MSYVEFLELEFKWSVYVIVNYVLSIVDFLTVKNQPFYHKYGYMHIEISITMHSMMQMKLYRAASNNRQTAANPYIFLRVSAKCAYCMAWCIALF